MFIKKQHLVWLHKYKLLCLKQVKMIRKWIALGCCNSKITETNENLDPYQTVFPLHGSHFVNLCCGAHGSITQTRDLGWTHGTFFSPDWHISCDGEHNLEERATQLTQPYGHSGMAQPCSSYSGMAFSFILFLSIPWSHRKQKIIELTGLEREREVGKSQSIKPTGGWI